MVELIGKAYYKTHRQFDGFQTSGFSKAATWFRDITKLYFKKICAQFFTAHLPASHTCFFTGAATGLS